MATTAQAATTRIGRSSVVLLLVNLLPLGGVLFLDWDVGALVVLYWAENLVVGAYNLLKMATVAGPMAVFPGLFFLIHYGGFCAVHGLFILTLLLGGSPNVGDEPPWPLFLVFVQLLVQVVEAVLAQAPPAWLLAVGGLVISHGYSFVTNFLLGGEREQATIRTLMSAPYRRIVVLHVAVIAGGFGVMALGEPLVLLLALVALKTVTDIALHRREHRPTANIDSENMAAR